MQNVGKSRTKAIAIVGGAILAIILVVGTIGMGVIARRDTDRAVRTVSRMYLEELAGAASRSWRTICTARST